MNRFWEHLDIQKLAGISTILGVDLGHDKVRIVELEKKGGLFNKLKGSFKVVNHFACEFSPDDSLATKAEKIKELVLSKRIKTKFAVSSIPPESIRVTTTTIPKDERDIKNWIWENQSRLLKLPISPSLLSTMFEVLEWSDQGTVIEITFVKNSEIEEFKTFYRQAGLELIAIGAGHRDAVNSLAVTEKDVAVKPTRFLYLNGGTLFQADFVDGSIRRMRQTFEQPDFGAIIQSNEQRDANLRIAGEIEHVPPEPNNFILNPFGLATEFTQAAGLAVKGFVPEISPANLLNTGEQAQVEERIYKRLTQRSIFTGGSVIFLLLLIQGLASFYISSNIETIDQELLSLGPSYQNVDELEKEVNDLSRRFGNESLSRRTDVARKLHQVASNTPGGVWLNRLAMKAETKEGIVTTHGYAVNNESVAEFLKSLSSVFSDVSLVRSGNPIQADLIPSKGGGEKLITFQVTAVTK